MNILEVKNLRKVYNSEDKNTEVVALKDINFVEAFKLWF